jgi:excisionase family DNA binding protein
MSDGHSTSGYAVGRPAALLTIGELAMLLGIGRTTAYRLVNSGAIRSVRVGERLRFRPEDIEAYLERGSP